MRRTAGRLPVTARCVRKSLVSIQFTFVILGAGAATQLFAGGSHFSLP